jgi:hypothetical protein
MPPNVPVSTTLSAAVGIADTTLAVSSVAGLPTAGAVQIDNEIVSYAGISGSTLTGAQRAQRTSAAAAHAGGAVVQQVLVFAMNSDEARVLNDVERDLETIFAGGAQGTAASGTVQVGALGKYFLIGPGDAATKLAVRDPFRAALLALQHNLAPAFTEASVVGPWTNAAGFNSAAYFRDGFGIVHFKGVVTGGALNGQIFQLPSGFRPALPTVLATAGAVSTTPVFACIQVGSDGIVKATAGTGAISLDGLSFRATQ